MLLACHSALYQFKPGGVSHGTVQRPGAGPKPRVTSLSLRSSDNRRWCEVRRGYT